MFNDISVTRLILAIPENEKRSNPSQPAELISVEFVSQDDLLQQLHLLVHKNIE